jgi:hypothetical protein
VEHLEINRLLGSDVRQQRERSHGFRLIPEVLEERDRV